MKTYPIALLLAASFGFVQAALADNTQPTQPDNSRINRTIIEDRQKTAEDQGSSASEVEVARLIRQELTQDDTLSVNAKNLKIIVTGSIVTLKGPVQSVAEKRRVVACAKRAAPNRTIRDEVTVVTASY